MAIISLVDDLLSVGLLLKANLGQAGTIVLNIDLEMEGAGAAAAAAAASKAAEHSDEQLRKLKAMLEFRICFKVCASPS